MLYKKFTIENYKAIDSIEVELNKNQLIPVIGINESGKTSILQAILAFDKNKDRSNRGRHLDHKNKYILQKEDCTITASVHIESRQEINEILERVSVKPKDKTSVESALVSHFEDDNGLDIRRHLSTPKKPYTLENTAIPGDYHKRIIKAVLEKLPFILYFDDFSDRVPESIDFPNEYSGEDSISSSSYAAEWQKLIEEAFKRSTDDTYNLIDFLRMEDSDDRDGLLSDVEDVLNNEIIEDWKALKSRGDALANDELNLSIKLAYTPWDNGSHSFVFKVVDRTKDKKSRHFNIVERSKGFQWFFNFILKLKFNPKYKTNPSGAIYLLDEPGSYLHTSAQEELLKELQRISDTNVIFYCTHSQHLLNPDIINVSSIKIASKDDGSINLRDFNSSTESDHLGALTPLYDALHMIAPIDSSSHSSAVLTEGITDFYFLNMLNEHTKLLSLKNTRVIPGAGASQLKDLMSLLISSRNPFCVLFDNDNAGRNASKKYKSFFGDEIAKRFIHYGTKDVHEKFEIEDYFTGTDRDKLLNITEAGDVKSAIIKLYFLDSDDKQKYFDSISEKFKSDLKRILSALVRNLEQK